MRGIKEGSMVRTAESKEISGSLVLPLNSVRSGKKVEVSSLAGGKEFQSRMCSMGITPGTEMMVTSNLGGPVVVRVRGSRLSLGRGMSAKILVRAEPGAR